jgi:TolB-like protein
MLAALLLVPTVAVMPFRDLSNGAGHAGDAISETVTADLRDVPGLRVVERREIDRVISEQNLQAKKSDLDAAGSIRVGTLLGATLIVAGAYQRVGESVRLTARFVDVATGEVKGSAKVDGAQEEFLKLQDRVTAELLKSAGLAPPPARKPRPKLRSWKPIELYGDAVTAGDDETRKKLLQAALNEDPQFSYAARDLDALEQRMRRYDDAAARAKSSEINQLYATLKTEKDPQKLWAAYVQLFGNLFTERRFRRVIELARVVIAAPPPVPPTLGLEETARAMLIGAYTSLQRWDDVLREGEIYVAKFPGSRGFAHVRWQIGRAIDMKRKIADGKQKAADEIAAHPHDDDCQQAGIYERQLQLPDARKKLESGLTSGCKMKRIVILSHLLWLCVRQADPACAERAAKAIEQEPTTTDGDARVREEAKKWSTQIARDD